MLVQKTRAKFPYIIEIVNEDLGVFRYANSSKNVTFEGNMFTAGLFSVTPPERTTTSISNAKLSISCVDQTWIDKIRRTQKRSSCRFIATIIYDTDNDTTICEAIEDNSFTLTSASWDDSNISWDMEFDDRMTVLVPVDIGSSQNCPGCA